MSIGRGRPSRNSVEGFAGAINAMIAEYEETGQAKSLSDYALGSRLNLSPTRLDKYYQGVCDKGDGERTYSDELKRLIAYRQQACVAHITKGGNCTGWIFLSKQVRWGGFSDTQKVESSGTQEITIRLKGANGKDIH